MFLDRTAYGINRPFEIWAGKLYNRSSVKHDLKSLVDYNLFDQCRLETLLCHIISVLLEAISAARRKWNL